MKCLVVGYGSIGRRHARILKGLGAEVFVASRHGVADYPCYGSIEDAVAKQSFDYAIIANRTVDHYPALLALDNSGFRGLLLIEKPLFERHRLYRGVRPNIFVGYNLRFHPVLLELRRRLLDQPCYAMNVYAGQYLPDWRPDGDYRKSYSASENLGGGVLMDLSHEIDYVLWLAGKWKRLAATGGKFSALEIDSDDVFCLMMSTAKCPSILIQLDYLDRERRRTIAANTEKYTIVADLVGNTLSVNGETSRFPVSSDYTYEEQHRAILAGKAECLCSLEEGLDTLELISEAKIASECLEWRIHET